MNRVLVVEDNPNNMKLINMVLKRHGYETIGAVTGEEGVEKAGTEKAGYDFDGYYASWYRRT